MCPRSSQMPRPIFLGELLDRVVLDLDLPELGIRPPPINPLVRYEIGDRFSVAANHDPRAAPLHLCQQQRQRTFRLMNVDRLHVQMISPLSPLRQRNRGRWGEVGELPSPVDRGHWSAPPGAATILGRPQFVQTILAPVPARAPSGAPAAEIAALCTRAGEHFGVSPAEIASPSLRRRVLAARAVVCHLAVCARGFSLSSVARCLGITRRSVVRAVARATTLLAAHDRQVERFLG